VLIKSLRMSINDEHVLTCISGSFLVGGVLFEAFVNDYFKYDQLVDHTYRPTYLPTYPPIYLSTYPHTHLPIYLPDIA
jgi:hypothetical protein